MRFAKIALLLMVAWSVVAIPAPVRADDKDPFHLARARCARWFDKDQKVPKAFEGKKITADSIASDFKDISQAVMGIRGFTSLVKEKFVENKDETPKTEDELVSLLVAIWYTWRTTEPKDGLKTVLADLGDFVKVRFKSQPKATVQVDDMTHGDTTVDVYLRKGGKYTLRMSAPNHETWIKEQFTPSKGQIFDETLKKK